MFLPVLAYLGNPRQKAIKQLCVCVCVCYDKVYVFYIAAVFFFFAFDMFGWVNGRTSGL